MGHAISNIILMFQCTLQACSAVTLSWVAKHTLHVIKYWKLSSLDRNVAADKWPNLPGQWPAPALLDGALPRRSSKSQLCCLRHFPGISFLWQANYSSQTSELNQTAPVLGGTGCFSVLQFPLSPQARSLPALLHLRVVQPGLLTNPELGKTLQTARTAVW